MKKRVYSTEFKSEAVRLSYQRENIKEVADELGVQVQRIYKWRAGQKTKASPKATIKLETDSIEVKRLRKALKKKELELEILKKAVHIFSKSDGNVGFPFL
jgi:transposase